MTRKKVKLAFISNDSTRKATFKKRKRGLVKKVNELSTLCGINTCAIIYSPFDSNPEVWPSPSGVQQVVSEFRMFPDMDQHKKMVDQESFLRQRIAKALEHLKRQRKENRELEMTEVMFKSLVGNIGMFHLNIVDLNDLGYIIDQYLKDINRRIEILGNSGMEIGESSNVVTVHGGIGSMAERVATTSQTTSYVEVGSSFSSAVAGSFFNPIQQDHHIYQQHQYQQQQFSHHVAPHVGFYEQSQNLNLNRNHNPNHNQNQQQWLMEMMNHPQQVNYLEQMGLPFTNDNHYNHNHHPQQQQHILGESSTAPGPVVPNTNISVTSPNVTNNLWSR